METQPDIKESDNVKFMFTDYNREKGLAGRTGIVLRITNSTASVLTDSGKVRIMYRFLISVSALNRN